MLSLTLFLGIKLKEKALTRTLLQIKFILFKLENSVAVTLDGIMVRIIVFFSLENDSSFCIIFIFPCLILHDYCFSCSAYKHFLVPQTQMTLFQKTLQNIGRQMKQKLSKLVRLCSYCCICALLLMFLIISQQIVKSGCLYSVLSFSPWFFLWTVSDNAAKEWTRLYASGA